MGEFKPSPKAAPPAYMVSFCDMMTLILTFFILLVSMSKEQQAGLVADGVGSFIIAIKSHGLDGILSGQEKAAILEHQRRKFNVPQDEPEESLTEVEFASNFELIKTKLLEALEPHDELTYPGVVEFPPDSAEIPASALPYLQRLAPSLQPKYRQTLLVEGHASDADARYQGDDRQLAFARALAIREFLIEEYGFKPERVEARAWHAELPSDGLEIRTVDLRLVTPGAHVADK
jgi:chemotaxis protein MotB